MTKMTLDEAVIRGYMLGLNLTANAVVEKLKGRLTGVELRFLEVWGPRIAQESFHQHTCIASGDYNYHRLQAEEVVAEARAAFEAAAVPPNRLVDLQQLMIHAETDYLHSGVVDKNWDDIEEHLHMMGDMRISSTLLSLAKEAELPGAIIQYLEELDSYISSLPPQE